MFDLRTAKLIASPHRRRTGRGQLDILAVTLRLAAAALLGGVFWIHLHLWQEGYRHIPTIGPLFLAGAVSALVVGFVLLVRPSRLVGLLAVGVDVGILASLVWSINFGLFGFKESLDAAFVVEAVAIEAIGAAALLLWVLVDLWAENLEVLESRASRDVPSDHGEQSWRRRAHHAEADADELARALDFHVVNECNCDRPADIATLRRHTIQVVSRGRRPVVGTRHSRP
jgi:hypothetical protein